MLKMVANRLLQLIVVLVGITILVFSLLFIIPGDPAVTLLGQDATHEEIERFKDQMGLNDSYWEQLTRYLTGVFKGDLGKSYIQNEDVLSIIAKSIPATLELAIVSLVISIVIAIPIGVISAVKRGTWIDYVGMIFAQIGVSMPVFWLGLLLILMFSIKFSIFPSFGRGDPLFESFMQTLSTGNLYYLYDSLSYIILPALALGFMSAAFITRMVRSAMLEVLEADYIRTADAKGVKNVFIIMKHAFRNALIPIVTIIGLQFGNLLGGAIVTETVFAWPGVGRLIVTAISQRDFSLVQGGVLVIAFLFALINLIVDLLYMLINPKIRE